MKIKEGKILHAFAKKIWHYNRSLTGEGTRETLIKIKNINSELKIKSIKSGTKVFDWTIPPEWIIDEAFINSIIFSYFFSITVDTGRYSR